MLTEEQYNRLVNRMVEGEGGCWVWQGALGTSGYPVATVARKCRTVHRLLWEDKNGPIPAGKIACHTCDNPLCCNPDHLFIGTQSDNMRDMHAKGRHHATGLGRRGEGNGMNRLTEAQVLDIRKRRREGAGYLSLAEELGVSEATVRLAAEGKRWAHLPGAIQAEERKALSLRGKLVRGENNVNAKLTAEKVSEIRNRAAAGELPSKFRREYGIALSTACDIIKGRIWRDT